jgi:hypothetical protein
MSFYSNPTTTIRWSAPKTASKGKLRQVTTLMKVILPPGDAA